MEEDILIPLAMMVMVLGWVGFVQVGSTLRHYLDWRLRMAERHSASADATVLQAVQELRAEIGALKRHESDAVLSFDSTLQRLEARLAHLERGALTDATGERVALTARSGRGADEMR